jgi:hypothetical protein
VDARDARWRSPRPRQGLAVTLPYFLGILRGWQPDRSGIRNEYLRLDCRCRGRCSPPAA